LVTSKVLRIAEQIKTYDDPLNRAGMPPSNRDVSRRRLAQGVHPSKNDPTLIAAGEEGMK
jgi:hypothetical protein